MVGPPLMPAVLCYSKFLKINPVRPIKGFDMMMIGWRNVFKKFSSNEQNFFYKKFRILPSVNVLNSN